ncbi:putative E3 ubiquitin-protein ligase RING1a isoform X1 [Daucus carota subsp. sativus]|uniref:putative E3 ubiquitin-protein ligase RING1a isoform X1 n=1 Tax=Daucus carota subsp. sativus TaxID=79200 RepID=UPI0007EFA4A8|nr:PREDICTED: putative E3 ubiquitin-protein ligase RING1a isoform X1 [Daucus carota subsp. sativus]
MPAQKRSVNSPAGSDDDNTNQNNNNSSVQRNQNSDEQPQEEQSDSNGSRSSSPAGDDEEYIIVHLPDIRKEVQCPICLGIIRKTRTVMECLHRFCRECIDKSMRLGNNECPACRTHCASRRSLRDDPKYDALISALYPDIDKYEEEELAFHEEERTRYKQIQDSIAQTQRRQSEALGKKRSSARATAAAFVRRSQVYRNSRGRRIQREQEASDEENYANGRDRVPGSADRGDENDAEVNRDSLGASAGLVVNSEMLAWGRGGMRSNTRHSNQSAGNIKIARSNRLSKLLESLQDTVEEDALKIHLILMPLDEQRLPSLQQPHMRCEPTATVRKLCQYVASYTAAEVHEIEIFLVQQSNKDVLRILEGHETLAELRAMYSITQHDMRFAYRQKLPASMNSVRT